MRIHLFKNGEYWTSGNVDEHGQTRISSCFEPGTLGYVDRPLLDLIEDAIDSDRHTVLYGREATHFDRYTWTIRGDLGEPAYPPSSTPLAWAHKDFPDQVISNTVKELLIGCGGQTAASVKAQFTRPLIEQG